MTDVVLIGKHAKVDDQKKVELQLVKDSRPTPLLIGLAAAEIAVDAGIAFAAYKIISRIRK